jgi:hypothetical protein
MAAAAEYLSQLGVEPNVARASRAVLDALASPSA